MAGTRRATNTVVGAFALTTAAALCTLMAAACGSSAPEATAPDEGGASTPEAPTGVAPPASAAAVTDPGLDGRGGVVGRLPAPTLAAPEPLPDASDAAAAFRLSFEGRSHHLVDVAARLRPSGGGPSVEVQMAVWTPGSYLVREYARHVEAVEARLSGTPGSEPTELVVAKVAKNRWTLTHPAGEPLTEDVVLRYRVYGREMSVRTNYVDDEFAIINGGPTYLVPVGTLDKPVEVTVALPDDWATAATGLDRVDGGTAGAREVRFLARDYDELVDSPFVLGTPDITRFEAGGAAHELVTAGAHDGWATERATADVKRIVEAQQAFWGVVPYQRYVVLNVLAESGGGLEHLDSTLMMTTRWATHTRKQYVSWLELFSHEFFHTWNVKRLRPRELGPFDYESENHTRSLWVAEGITSYYDMMFVKWAGVMTESELLDRIGGQVSYIEQTPGRFVRSLGDSSYDAWIRYYRRDENSRNTDVSYYAKGALVAWLLDVRIRTETGGDKSLGDVMRLAYERHSGERGFTPAEFAQAVEDATGVDAAAWLHEATETTSPLDYTPALDALGLRFDRETPGSDDGDGADDDDPTKGPDPPTVDLGATLKGEAGRWVLDVVNRGAPAYEAGLQSGDELIALDGWRLGKDGWEPFATRFAPGREAVATLSRRGKLIERTITFREGGAKGHWKLVARDDAPDAAKARRAAWFAGPGPVAAAAPDARATVTP